jgi:serine phosphatase RsbU (regulator of sigma subunit)
MVPIVGLIIGTAVWSHAMMYFPRTRPEVVKLRWIMLVQYGLALLSIAFLVAEKDIFTLFIIAMIVFNIIIAIKYRHTHDDESKKINKFILKASVLGVVLCFGISLLLNYTRTNGSLGFLIPLVLLAIPFSYLYVIGRYRLFNIDIRLRRNIQYTVISLLWPAFLLFVAVRLILFIIHADLNIPNIRITGASFELLDSPLTVQEQSIAEKAIAADAAILIALGFIWLGKRGQKFINHRYYRNQYDYKKAAQEISEVTASKVEIPTLARGVIEKIAEIMHVKQAAILIFKSEDDLLCGESFGVPEESFKKMVRALDRKALKAVRAFRMDSRFSVENLPENIKNAFKELNFRHLVPLYAKDRLTGALIIGEKLSESPFHTEDFSFLTAVSNQISIAIENAFLYENLAEQERLKHELEIARRIQLESLPQTTPNIRGLDISGISKPALEVGGDYFDYLENSPKCITIVIGDVSGKGTSAALYMSKVQGMIRSLHEITASTPQQLLNHANKLLHLDIDRRSYITALGARFDSAEKSVTLSRAGHLPLYHFSAETNCFKKILPKGIGLALSGNKLFSKALEEVQCSFKSGDIFLMLTDGITEAQNLLKEEFGAERVEKIITQNAFLKAEEIRDKVIAEMEAFAGEAEQHDDCTVIVVKVI